MQAKRSYFFDRLNWNPLAVSYAQTILVFIASNPPQAFIAFHSFFYSTNILCESQAFQTRKPHSEPTKQIADCSSCKRLPEAITYWGWSFNTGAYDEDNVFSMKFTAPPDGFASFDIVNSLIVCLNFRYGIDCISIGIMLTQDLGMIL